MGDKTNDGDHLAGKQDGGSKLDWQHLWKSVENAGTQAGHAVKKQVDQIDTKDLADKAKHVAGEGLKIARGKSDNHEVNQYSDAAARYIPGAGLLREGANIAHETGADGKILEGKKGPLHAPSERTLKEASSQAVGTLIPIPGAGIVGNEVLNRSGVKERVIDGAFDAAKSHGSHPSRLEAHSKNSAKDHLPPVTIDDTKHDDLLVASKKKVQEIFHGFSKK